jgi:hypothetical protein
MNEPPTALTLESQGAHDSGLMSPTILRQLAAMLSADIAIHHREVMGEGKECASPGTIQQSRSNGRNTTFASYYETEDNKDFVPHMYKEGYILASLSYLMGIQSVTRIPAIRTQQVASSQYSAFASELSDAPYLEAMIMPCAWTYENLGLATTVGFMLDLPTQRSEMDHYHSPNICFFGAINRSIVVTKDFLQTVYDLGTLLTSLSATEFDLTDLNRALVTKRLRKELSIVN